MMMPMNPFLGLIMTVLWLYRYVVIATVIMSWLIAFNIVNRSNPYVRQIAMLLERLTEPLLQPIRRLLPDLGAIDISPVILLLAILFVEMAVPWLFYSIF